MTGNIIGIVGQRLLRRLCPHCKQAYTPEGLEMRLLGVENSAPAIYRPVGCDRCYQTGYKGRLVIMEILRIDADLDNLIAKAATPQEIEKKAREYGFKSLADEGIIKILDGSTSIDELSRIVDLTHRIH
jgi:type II secretory ATPase GspE/PulE/Tfp pilus assembly ATPase PilB-like protein